MSLIAHVKTDEKSGEYSLHDLKDHLAGVADLAGGFAAKFGNSDWLRAASYLHDMGKGSSEFQEYIRRNSGFEKIQAHIECSSGRVIHSTQGAEWAYRNWEKVGKVLAYLVAGHHAGLPDWNHEIGVGGNLENRLVTENTEQLPEPSNEFITDITEKLNCPVSLPGNSRLDEKQIHVWIRMLFSCLVDADFLDTERFMNPEKFASRGEFDSLLRLKQKFDSYINVLTKNIGNSSINRIRSKVLSNCRKKAKSEPGLFSLTVPTGGGKTLSSMAFALEHAIVHGKERIIVVIPYTSIIEQTAEVYKRVFGEKNVIEHHSSLDPEKESARSRLATENWDAPIIVTTSVQFFESLFSSRTSACRKLHNIVNSVVILDEAQMIPTDYLEPILYCIKGLTNHFGVSLVFCTATQPALCRKIFQRGDGSMYSILEEENCREIMRFPSPKELALSLKRVKVERMNEQIADWGELAGLLAQHDQVLCIVNTRNDCRNLHEKMPKGTIHLSANMCAEHRSQVINNIKNKLKAGKQIRIVSTQLVEAGVDIDFPVVFRAMTGFDSIAQSAGRCNREGKLAQHGKVFVFEPPQKAPAGKLRKGADSGRTIINMNTPGWQYLFPEVFEKYFLLYFSGLNSFDKKNIADLLCTDANPDLNIQFRTAAQKFHLIEDQDQVTVIVKYSGENNSSKALIRELKNKGPSRNLMRKLQRFSVTIPKPYFDNNRESFKEIQGIWCQEADRMYDPVLGYVGHRKDEILVI